MKYRCIETFLVDKCDDDGFTIENQYNEIKKGTEWYTSEDGYRFVDGEVQLLRDHDKTTEWLEITNEHLKEYFEEIK